MKTFIVALGGFLLLPCITTAQVLMSHLGSTDPLHEGFTVLQGSAAQGSPVNDGGIEAWRTTGQGSSSVLYSQSPANNAGQTLADTHWRLEFGVRLTELADNPDDFGVSVGILAGTRLFQVLMGTTAEGDPLLVLPLELEFQGQDPFRRFEMSGAGAGYHSYFLEYNPATGLAQVGFDQTVLDVGYSGRGVFGDENVMFGGSGIGSAHWQSLQLLVVVPEPEDGTSYLICTLIGATTVKTLLSCALQKR